MANTTQRNKKNMVAMLTPRYRATFMMDFGLGVFFLMMMMILLFFKKPDDV